MLTAEGTYRAASYVLPKLTTLERKLQKTRPDYVDYIREFIQHIGTKVHVISVCQPTVPVLAAISLLASAGGAVAGGRIDGAPVQAAPQQAARGVARHGGAGLLALYVPTFWDLMHGLWSTDQQGHGPIVLGISCWLIYRNWPAMLAKCCTSGPGPPLAAAPSTSEPVQTEVT